jgi:hypothetical protein
LKNSVSHLPDPALPGPYRPFARDPGWSEAWWWLAIPVLFALFVIGAWKQYPDWYLQRVKPEGYGILEFSQFTIILAAFALAARLLFMPFVRRRPFVFAITLTAALSCLYIAGEEVSWGQHFFHWNTPDYWVEVNRQAETNLHNTYAVFEKYPRAVLEIGVVIGGILIPIAAAFAPWLRACRLSLFFPPAALMPSAIGAMAFKLSDILVQKGYAAQLAFRPSETIELYLYYFILTYLIVFARRIREIEASDGGAR